MSDTYKISAYPSSSFQGQSELLGGEGYQQQITHIATPEGTELLVTLEGNTDSDSPSVSEMEASLVAALIADLLRDGWDEIARPITRPVLQEGRIFRGFVLRRSARLWNTDQAWKLTVLLPAKMEEAFDWSAVQNHIDRFSEYFMSVA